mmetsp:Transcript_30583/g.64459  ORF Transcript_30583/g.64459 Transcript_30583/m.64459 type:complete len:378 (+) Transcript_30583:289-1422(+)
MVGSSQNDIIVHLYIVLSFVAPRHPLFFSFAVFHKSLLTSIRPLLQYAIFLLFFPANTPQATFAILAALDISCCIQDPFHSPHHLLLLLLLLLFLPFRQPILDHLPRIHLHLPLLEPLQIVIQIILPNAPLRLPLQKLVLRILALVNATQLRLILQIPHESPRVHIVLTRPDLPVVQQFPLLEHGNHVGGSQHARRLDVRLGHVDVEGVEADEDPLVEGHGRGPVGGAERGVGGVFVDGVAGGEVAGVGVDLGVDRDAGADAEDEGAGEEGGGDGGGEAEAGGGGRRRAIVGVEWGGDGEGGGAEVVDHRGFGAATSALALAGPGRRRVVVLFVHVVIRVIVIWVKLVVVVVQVIIAISASNENNCQGMSTSHVVVG